MKVHATTQIASVGQAQKTFCGLKLHDPHVAWWQDFKKVTCLRCLERIHKEYDVMELEAEKRLRWLKRKRADVIIHMDSVDDRLDGLDIV